MINISDRLVEIRDAIVNEELEQAIALLDELADIIDGELEPIDRDVQDALANELGNHSRTLYEESM